MVSTGIIISSSSSRCSSAYGAEGRSRLANDCRGRAIGDGGHGTRRAEESGSGS